ncbi:MAG TPA: hypothetical protein VGI20_05480 [Rhizomicrobium sp.]
MQRNVFGNGPFWIALAAGLCAVAPALALDPACQAPFSVQMSLRSKPFHVYMTSEDKFSSGTLSKAAAGMGMAGVKQSEEIWTGKDIYVLHNGKWIDMQTSFTEMNKDDTNDPDIKKARDAERCVALPDETVFGQNAAVYRIHNPELGADTKIWVSKTSHLPLKSEITTSTGPMTSFATSRYEYTNTQAPANSISMRDMIKRR